MLNENDFRRIALGMKGAIESAHMGHPDFPGQRDGSSLRSTTIGSGGWSS